MIIISPSERVPIHSHNSNQSTRPLSMSLLGRAGLDLRSWVKSLRASHRIILICIIGFVLALLGLRILGTPADTYLALAFYHSISPDTFFPLIFGIATLGDLIWVPRFICTHVLRKDRHDWTCS